MFRAQYAAVPVVWRHHRLWRGQSSVLLWFENECFFSNHGLVICGFTASGSVTAVKILSYTTVAAKNTLFFSPIPRAWLFRPLSTTIYKILHISTNHVCNHISALLAYRFMQYWKFWFWRVRCGRINHGCLICQSAFFLGGGSVDIPAYTAGFTAKRKHLTFSFQLRRCSTTLIDSSVRTFRWRTSSTGCREKFLCILNLFFDPPEGTIIVLLIIFRVFRQHLHRITFNFLFLLWNKPCGDQPWWQTTAGRCTHAATAARAGGLWSVIVFKTTSFYFQWFRSGINFASRITYRQGPVTSPA